MSWSVRVQDESGSALAVRVAEMPGVLDRALEFALSHNYIPADQQGEEFEDAWAAAKAAAMAIAHSPALGGCERVYVSMSGHVNPGHQRQPGWADDTVTVTVTQAQDDAPYATTPESGS